MGKTKGSCTAGERKSARLALRCQKSAETKPRKLAPVKKAGKQKAKPAENGNSKAEEPKAEATEAK